MNENTPDQPAAVFPVLPYAITAQTAPKLSQVAEKMLADLRSTMEGLPGRVGFIGPALLGVPGALAFLQEQADAQREREELGALGWDTPDLIQLLQAVARASSRPPLEVARMMTPTQAQRFNMADYDLQTDALRGHGRAKAAALEALQAAAAVFSPPTAGQSNRAARRKNKAPKLRR